MERSEPPLPSFEALQVLEALALVAGAVAIGAAFCPNRDAILLLDFQNSEASLI
jgi:hypothetical protein